MPFTKRLDTRLESEAAEFLVLGNLLLEKIATYKTYTNMPGYDLVATNPERNTSAKIQVKSRWRTNAPGFPIKNFGCDFVVFCRLNRGSKKGTAIVRAPEFYVFPVALVRGVWNPDDTWGKVAVKQIKDWESFLNRWDLIRTFLGGTPVVEAPLLRNEVPKAMRTVHLKPTAGPKMSIEELRRRAVRLDGQVLETLKQRKPFLVHVHAKWLEITPRSSGKARRVRWNRMERVLQQFNETGSTNPVDYVDVTQHGSYFLAVLLKVLE